MNATTHCHVVRTFREREIVPPVPIVPCGIVRDWALSFITHVQTRREWVGCCRCEVWKGVLLWLHNIFNAHTKTFIEEGKLFFSWKVHCYFVLIVMDIFGCLCVCTCVIFVTSKWCFPRRRNVLRPGMNFKKSVMTYCSAPVFHGGLWGRSLYRVAHKFLLLVWYTDDVFLKQKNRRTFGRSNIQRTVGPETDYLPVYGVTETKEVCFGCKVYRKAIRTNEYLIATSHDHPANKHSLLCTVRPRPKTTSE